MVFGTVINSFSTLPETPLGICTDGKDLFISDSPTRLIRYNKAGVFINVNRVDSFGGIEFDGKYFWLLTLEGAMLYQFNREGRRVYSVAMAIPTEMPPDLCFDGKDFYGSESTTGNLYKFNREGIMIDIIALPNTNYAGITTDNKYLYIFESDANQIHKFNKDAVLIDTCPAPGGATIGPMCFDGKYIWFGDDNNNRVYQISIG